MLTTLNHNKYPFFDLSEIVSEPDLPFKQYSAIEPVRVGNYLPNFSLQNSYTHWQYFFNGTETHGSRQPQQLLSKPLVVSFYSPVWQQHGLDQLKRLNAIQSEIRANGGNLLIITAEKGGGLEKLAWENNLSLNFYFDANHQLAQSFRIYSDADPAWNRFSGIDTNVPLPATYVLDAGKQIVYDHTHPDFGDFNPAEIIIAVYNASLAASFKKSA